MKLYRSGTNLIWLVGRIQTNTASDYAFVHQLQDGLTLAPLSGEWAERGRQGKDGGARPESPIATIQKMNAAAFFRALSVLMKANPPAEADVALMARLAKIGIVAGKDFDFASLPPAVQDALNRAVKETEPKLASPPSGQTVVNGWRIIGNLGTYGADYSLRSFIARVGLGANLPEDAMYPSTKVDSDGRPLDGSHRYVLHFDKEHLPPVRAFWSLTMYDARGFFIENPIGRYAIGDRDRLKFNADGSLDLYIQAARPGAEKESNWLPAPKEVFNLSLRLYWPKEAALKRTWAPPPVRRVD